MKKLITGAIAGIFAFVVIVGGLYMLLPEEDRDHLNPLIPKENLYVRINESPVPVGPRFEYTLTGYTDEGEKREVTFSAGKVLKENAYLKIVVKGSFVEEWEELSFEQLPEKIKEKLGE